MKEFLKTTHGQTIVLVIFFLFVYLMNRSWYQVGFMAFGMLFFMIIGKLADKRNRNPKYIHSHFLPLKIEDKQKLYLTENYSFYNRLKPKYKLSFEHRVAKFLKKYQIISRDNSEITEEMKTIIAGCYVHLTFGMNNFLTYKFKKILIYQNPYFSSITGKVHTGEYNPHLKLIVFCWSDFLEGIKKENDCYNLGIHEFTHAILDESRKSNSDKSSTSFNDFETGYDKIKKLLENTSYYKNLSNSNFFRNYAFTNIEEFISVIMEYFFENPEKFKANFPEIYLIVEKMINYQKSWFQN